MKTTTQTNHKNANPPPKGNSQTATNVANTVSLNGDGTVNFSNYVESHDFLDTLTQEEMLNTSPAPHQHTQESETESEDDVPYLDLNLKQGASDSRHSEDTPANPKTNTNKQDSLLNDSSSYLTAIMTYRLLPPRLKTWLKQAPPL